MRLPRRRIRGRMLLVALSATALLGLGGARASAQSAEGPGLVVYTSSFGSDSLTAITLDAAGSATAVDVFVPAGYGVASATPGAEVGYVSVALTDARRSDVEFASGELVADDQAASPGPVDECAPGTHTARWHADLGLVGRSPLRLFVYVDAQPAGAESAAVLRLCPVWQGGGAPAVVGEYVSLIVEDQISEPSSPGVETWRAVVEPGAWVGDTLVAKSESRFEIRSLVAHPHTLTLAARYDAPKKTAVLTGRLLAAGRPEPGVAVHMGAWSDRGDDFSSFGPVVTNAAGEFTVRRRTTASTTFTASVEPLLRACQTPSSVPGGCRSESVSPPTQASASVRVREKWEAKLVPRARDQALARRAGLRAEDFPAGWQGISSSDPLFPCPGFKPDLSKLTVGGEAASLFFIAPDQGAGAWSSTEVYASEEDARTAFKRTATIAAARCVANDAKGDDVTIVSVAPQGFARAGDATRAFRIVLSDSQGIAHADLVYVRRGRTLIRITFVGAADFDALEAALARAVAARAR